MIDFLINRSRLNRSISKIKKNSTFNKLKNCSEKEKTTKTISCNKNKILIPKEGNWKNS